MTSFKPMVGAVALAAAALFSSNASAQSFECITGNSDASCAQAEAALSWTFEAGVFTIFNAVGSTAYVAEVYFDLADGMSVSFLSGTGTVSFSEGAAPPQLPGGNTVGFVSDAAFDSDAPGGPPVYGINGGESASFTISGGSLFDAGVHVRGLVNGQSESLVTTTPPIPEPSTYALMLAGLGVVGWMARRRRPV